MSFLRSIFTGQTIKHLFVDASPIAVETYSGVGHSLLGLLKAIDTLPNRDWRVTLFIPSDAEKYTHNWKFQTFEVKTVPLSSQQILELQLQDNLPKLDKILGDGVYFFPNFLSWRLQKAKSILMVHDISFELHPEFVDPPNQKFLSRNVPRSIRRSDVVVTVSPTAKQEIQEFYHLAESKIIVVPNAVDSTLFYRRENRQIQVAQQKYGVSGQYFIFVGNLEPRKNLVRLIMAYEALPKSVTQKVALLLVGGDGWNDSEIKETINHAIQSGYKIMRPKKFVVDKDLPALYSGSKALVYPPTYEGFGMPPLEAMACGVPVISSNIMPLNWVTSDAALPIDPYKTGSITQAMKDVLRKSTSDQLVKKGTAQLANFSWENSAKTLIKVAEQL